MKIWERFFFLFVAGEGFESGALPCPRDKTIPVDLDDTIYFSVARVRGAEEQNKCWSGKVAPGSVGKSASCKSLTTQKQSPESMWKKKKLDQV